MRNLHFRRTARTSALGTVALIASLSLTACQGDDAAASGGSTSAPAGSVSQAPAENTGASGDQGSTASPADQGKDSAGTSNGSGSDSGSDSGSSSGSSSDGGTSKTKPKGDDESVTVTCTGANTKLSMTEVQRPANHMLLTMTNTGSKACNAYYHPYLQFGEAQSVPKTFEESKPQAVATINPGESVYTGVMTSSADGSGSDGYSTKDLTVGFQNRDGNSEGTGSTVNVPLFKSVFVDSSLSVTYWQMSMDEALQY